MENRNIVFSLQFVNVNYCYSLFFNDIILPFNHSTKQAAIRFTFPLIFQKIFEKILVNLHSRVFHRDIKYR